MFATECISTDNLKRNTMKKQPLEPPPPPSPPANPSQL